MFRPIKNILRDWGRGVSSTFIRYDSARQAGAVLEQLSPNGHGYVHFQREDIVARIVQEAHRVEFYGADEAYICSAEIPAVDSGRRAYLNVRVYGKPGRVVLGFPVCEWIDHYPHCDGEYDRWDTVILGFHTLTFDLTANTTALEPFAPGKAN